MSVATTNIIEANLFTLAVACGAAAIGLLVVIALRTFKSRRIQKAAK